MGWKFRTLCSIASQQLLNAGCLEVSVGRLADALHCRKQCSCTIAVKMALRWLYVLLLSWSSCHTTWAISPRRDWSRRIYSKFHSEKKKTKRILCCPIRMVIHVQWKTSWVNARATHRFQYVCYTYVSYAPPTTPHPPLTGSKLNGAPHAEREYQFTHTSEPIENLYLIRLHQPPPAHERKASGLNRLFRFVLIVSPPGRGRISPLKTFVRQCRIFCLCIIRSV